jgi:hypothetical protein
MKRLKPQAEGQRQYLFQLLLRARVLAVQQLRIPIRPVRSVCRAGARRCRLFRIVAPAVACIRQQSLVKQNRASLRHRCAI